MEVKTGRIKGKFNNAVFKEGLLRTVSFGQALLYGVITFGNVSTITAEDIENLKSNMPSKESNATASATVNKDLVYKLVEEEKITEKEFDILYASTWGVVPKELFTFKELENVKFVQIYEPIEKLEFLKYVPHLENLLISNCQDFSYLSSLNLKIISLVNSNFSNADFKYLPRTLENLRIENCSTISEIEILSENCPKLEMLIAEDSSFATIKKLPESLIEMDISENKNIRDLSSLSHMCPNLESLNIDGCDNVEKLYFITQLQKLKSFEFSNRGLHADYIKNYLKSANIATNRELPEGIIDNSDMLIKASEDEIKVTMFDDADLIYDKGVIPDILFLSISTIVGKNINEISFGDLKKIRVFQLIDNYIDNLDFLYYMPNLERLGVRGVSDLTALKYTKIKYLTLESGSFIDEDLKNIPSTVETLDVSKSMYIQDLSVLAKNNQNLKKLYIRKCGGINNLDFINSLPNLEYLRAEELTCITDEFIEYCNNKGINHNLKAQDVLNNYKLDEMLKNLITDEMDEEAKVRAIMNYVNGLEYFFDAEYKNQNAPLTYALNENKGVCIGYAYLASALLQRAGVEAYCLLANNTISEEVDDHALNIIKIGNNWVLGEPQHGIYYEQPINDVKEDYNYLVIPDEFIREMNTKKDFDKYIYPASAIATLGTLAGLSIIIARERKKHKCRTADEKISMQR